MFIAKSHEPNDDSEHDGRNGRKKKCRGIVTTFHRSYISVGLNLTLIDAPLFISVDRDLFDFHFALFFRLRDEQ